MRTDTKKKSAPAARTPLEPALRRLILVVVIGTMMTSLDIMIVNIAIVTLDHQFHAPLATIQWVVTGYLLALSMTIPITGWVVVRFGTKTTWLVSLTLFTVGSVLSGAAWSITTLIIFRVLQGIGGGMLLPAGQTMLARAAGPQQMGRMSSIIAIPAMISPVFGPVVGGLIISHLNWRWMFFVNVPVCAAAMLLALRMLPPDRDRERGHKLDVVGLLLLSPGLATLVYGLSQAASPEGLTNPRLLVATGLGIVLLAAFCRHALRTARTPLADLRLFRLRTFRNAAIGLFGYTATVLSVDLVLSLYLQTVRGQSPLHTGLLVAPWGIGAALTMVLSMRIIDRRSPRLRVLFGILPVLAGAVVYSQVGPDTNLAVITGAMLLIGLGHGITLPALTATIYRELVRSAVPAASILFNIVARVAGSFGTATAAVVLQIQVRLMMPRVGGSGVLSDLSGPGSQAQSARRPLAAAFAHSFWWAVALGAIVLVAATRIPRPVQIGAALESDGVAASRDEESEGRKAS
jgi:EmrB/QacA subfamily drug resistance transporter